MTAIRDIAIAAGVSVGTVSNYLNDPGMLSEKTRQKIKTKIEELDYHPHAAARSLKSRHTRRIGLVPIISSEDNRSSNPGDNAFLELLSGLNTVAGENGYDILISSAINERQEYKTYERLIGESQVDGLVLMGIRPQDERLRFLNEKKFPFIFFGSSNDAIEYPYVDVDGAHGIELAIQHLVSLGHQRIAYITPPAELMCTQQRWIGYVKGMEDHHLQINKKYVVEGGFTERDGQIATYLLLDLPEPPTAIITANDNCAFGAIRVIQARGFLVPRDISVIGFDDIALAEHWQPPLTTISQPFRKIGFELMHSLFSIINGEKSIPRILLEPSLVVRNSTARWVN